MPVIGTFNSNLCLFRLAEPWRNNFIDGSGHAGAGSCRSSRSVQTQFRYSCRLGNAWLRHFFLDAVKRRVVSFCHVFIPPPFLGVATEFGGKGSFQAFKLQRPARTTVCSHSPGGTWPPHSIDQNTIVTILQASVCAVVDVG